jgi:2-oxo-4-hydroxy-4-carboxy-5-ureidoimidazoline decarboxylase
MTLEELNRLDRGRFVETLGAIYEHSPWVAQAAFHARPFATSDDLARAMAQAVAAADETRQQALIDAHPDLGVKLGRASALAPSSRSEQASLGLDRLPEAEHTRLDALNRAYRARFGFPFIIAVRDHNLESLAAAFELRLRNDLTTERRTALEQIDRIAALRLETLMALRDVS